MLQYASMNVDFFRNNRANLGKLLQGGLVVVPAYDDMQRGNDMAHKFEQEANFWYLSGINASRWMIVYDGTRNHTWCVAPELTDVEKIFDGSLDMNDVKKLSGADEVISQAEFEPLLRQLFRHHANVYTVFPSKVEYGFSINPAQKRVVVMLERIFSHAIDCRETIERMRAIKQQEEVNQIKKAIAITAKAFAAVKQSLETCRSEYEVEALFDYEIRRAGASMAYDSIIAGGKSACTLHYTANNQLLRKQSIILCDVGARWGGYAADVSRNFAYGEPTKRQTMIHDRLRQAQSEIVSCIRPGMQIVEYHAQVDTIMFSALQDMGYRGESKEKLLRSLMPHAVSHGLGIDVHDPLGRPKVLLPGMVITVEPGVYIQKEKIGMRIEDDILITERGVKNMSKMISTEL